VSAHHVGSKLMADIELLFDDAISLQRASAVGRGVSRRVEKLDEVHRCVVTLRAQSNVADSESAIVMPTPAPAEAPAAA